MGPAPLLAPGRYACLGNSSRLSGGSPQRWLSSHFHKLLSRTLATQEAPHRWHVAFIRTVRSSSYASSSMNPVLPSIVGNTVHLFWERRQSHIGVIWAAFP